MTLTAVALVESTSIARGYVALDALAKRASVAILRAEAVSPGKFIIVFAGPLAHVEESYHAALVALHTNIIDALILPNPHPRLLPAMRGMADHSVDLLKQEAAAVMELSTVASTLRAADIALKSAPVSLPTMKLAFGLGGKGYATLTGTLGDVESAVESVRDQVFPEHIVAIEIIPQMYREVRGFL